MPRKTKDTPSDKADDNLKQDAVDAVDEEDALMDMDIEIFARFISKMIFI